MVFMALVGAVLAVVVRPRLIGVPLAIGGAEGLRGIVSLLAPAAVDNPQAPWWSQWSLAIELDPLAGYLPLLGASGGAALIAAILMMLTAQKTPRAISLSEATQVRRRVVNGHYVRAEGMIEERPRQTKAEERQKAILGL